MNPRPLIASLVTCLLVSGCATFNDSELGIIHQSGVSPRVFAKMEQGRVLSPDDVIELTRRHVPDRYIVRQLEDAGVDYVLSPEDYQRLQKARVSPEVLEALVAASDEFASRYTSPRAHVYVADPYYDDYYFPHRSPVYVTGDIGVGFSSHHHMMRHWR
jgi:hypothetical protein